MNDCWQESRRALIEGAEHFVRTVASVGDRWDRPGLGEWDVRALVGHTGRSLLTVEAYLAVPAAAVEVPSAAEYYRRISSLAAGPAVTRRGRDAGAALGDDPAAATAAIAERVVPLLDGLDGTELVTTVAGGMRLADYLPTRTFELAVHTADLAVALGMPAQVPEGVARQALRLAAELAVLGGVAGPLLLSVTGRQGLPAGFTLL